MVTEVIRPDFFSTRALKIPLDNVKDVASCFKVTFAAQRGETRRPTKEIKKRKGGIMHVKNWIIIR